MPRSPARDLSDRFTGKRGYFRNPDGLRRAKTALAVVCLLGAGAWATVDLLRPSKAAYAHTHGPLANPHAAFDDNCAACHVAHGLSEAGPISAFKARDRWHDLTCEKCHAGPPHHASANAKALDFHNRCSNCHHDHNGRLNSLVRLADKDCNQCHQNLGDYHDPAKSKAGKPYQNAITSFVKDHPEFRSLGVDPNARTLTFSHAVHMTPGQTYEGGQGKPLMTVERLRTLNGGAGPAAAAAVARYAPGAAEGDAVQLACASCHALDAGTSDNGKDGLRYKQLKDTLANGDPTRALLPPRAEGAHFLPVMFEAHCRSCHPLSANEGVNENGERKFLLPRFDLPHRVQPPELREVLKSGYVKALIADGQPIDPPKDRQPLGKLDPPQNLSTRSLAEKAQGLTDRAEQLLLTERSALQPGQEGCFKCHVTPGTKDRIAPVPDRTVWFQHAKFNHASHRGTECATCHPGIKEKGEFISRDEADKPEPVQILGLKTCQACHAPAGTKVTLPDGTETLGGGTRHSCTDCHRYHNGDNPLQGRGAAARSVDKPLTLAEWLRGNR